MESTSRPSFAPLQSVFCEVRFPGAPQVEASRAEFFAKVRSEFPALRVPVAREGAASALQHYRFSRVDDTQWVGIAVNSFVYGIQGGQYRSFEHFLARFMELVTLFADICPLVRETGLTRVGLRYQNHVPVSRGANGEIDDVPLVLPLVRIGDSLTENILTVQEHRVGDNLLRFIVDTTQEKLSPDAALLDLDCGANADATDTIAFTALERHLEQTHDVIKKYLVELLVDDFVQKAGIR